MSKINLKVSINDSDNNIKGIIQDNILKYTIAPYKTKYNYNTNTLINENEETRLEIRFDKNKSIGKLLYKPINKEFEVDIKTNTIDINNYNLEIKYEVNEEEYLYRIEEIK